MSTQAAPVPQENPPATLNAAPDQPWARQHRESVKAYAALVVYLQMGEKRTTRAVAERVGKHQVLIWRWSSRHKWVERARAFDNWNAQVEFEQMRASRHKAFKRHADIGRMFQQKGLEIIQNMNLLVAQAGQTPGAPGQLPSPNVAARYVEMGAKLERLAMGDEEQQAPPQIIVNIIPRAPRTKEEAALETPA